MERDTKSTSGARSTNTPNLPFFFSPYVITRGDSHPGCWPATTAVNSRTPQAHWERIHRSGVRHARL
ncbi:hypothetical protein FNJ62_12355 [Streptomyces benahoarensis]|uniref:Uncharacterized protein n=1 Tax=Streptomyces benahoarensis TaxID=2595054 RepID=A0A553ZLC0_9ACTN|nr:hypothetical protein FNJ62_12355 [Streptomyces benahoarensis]TSB42279.1 hypothetical protein FNZ23_10750 [Streptomyces benahoarensis]